MFSLPFRCQWNCVISTGFLETQTTRQRREIPPQNCANRRWLQSTGSWYIGKWSPKTGWQCWNYFPCSCHSAIRWEIEIGTGNQCKWHKRNHAIVKSREILGGKLFVMYIFFSLFPIVRSCGEHAHTQFIVSIGFLLIYFMYDWISRLVFMYPLHMQTAIVPISMNVFIVLSWADAMLWKWPNASMKKL